MINPKMYQKPVIGIGIAAIVTALCLAAFAADSARIEKPAAVDAEQYADFIENEVFDIQDLAEGAEIQRRFFNRITPPGFTWLQPMFPPVVPFDATDFGDSFLDDLLGEDKNSVAIYPLSLALDPKTRETLVYNADGKLIATIPADKIVRSWPEDADPARVTLLLDLLPSEDVEPYLYTESRVEESIASAAKKSAKVSDPVKRSLGASDFGICNIQKLTNGNMRLTVTNGMDIVEVYAYTVLHTSSVVVATWTNEESNVVTDTNTVWTPVSPPFNGIESEWASATTNLALTSGVGAWEDANISSNARIRFCAVANRMDSDEDDLTDGAEIFLHRTDPNNPDSDGDDLPDGAEVNTYGTNPNNSDTDGDGLPDAWEVHNELDPLDNGSIDPSNGPGGDPDEDGFDNALELELEAPPDNPAWNGKELAYRLTHAHSVTNTRSITTNLIGMRVDIEDSENCGGSNNGRQDVVDTLAVPALLDFGYFIDITVDGSVEDQNDYYDQVHIEAYTNTYYFEGSENHNGCGMANKSVTRNVLILPYSTVVLRYDTMSYMYHVGAYAEITDAILSGGTQVIFDKDPVKAGICLDGQNHDLRGTVLATITPTNAADQVVFVSSNPSRATVAEDSRINQADSVVVTLKVTGVSATPDTEPAGDTDLLAMINGQLCDSTKILVVVPKANTHSTGSISFENIAFSIAGTNLYHPGSRATCYVTTTFQDQFGDTLDSIYDGYHVVTEEFQDIHGNPIFFPAGEVFINVPDGNLQNGVIMDEVSDMYYLANWVDDITYASAWESFTRYINGCNNAFSLEISGDDDRDALQLLRVHGHEVTPSYRRTISTKDANYPPIPFTMSDTP